MLQTAASILMVRPACFGYNTETALSNAFQQKVSKKNKKATSEKAVMEFDRFIAQLMENDIDVMVIQDTKKPEKPDAVFPNNWFCTLPSGIVCVFPMQSVIRRGEKRNDILEMLTERFTVKDVQDWSEYEAEEKYLESTGSMVIAHISRIIYACISVRTNRYVLEQFARAYGYKVFAFAANDENGTAIYHTNVMMHIGEGYAVVCTGCITDKAELAALKQLLASTGHEIIEISMVQMRCFSGNMIQVRSRRGKKFTILSERAYESLKIKQRRKIQSYSHLLKADIATIENAGGGGVRCMIAEIFLFLIQN
mgnify:CR=1 FL=1